ncbi:hypothetical protein Val02_04180 [Virgisporangium aliadipatigenens]|uniref:Transmembrane protein n=1 Tax=Virgisporangium aliadipatigenens TaxID=741659 RepID=A0A8J3YFM0_9ACTN|nr:hypothetical protein [Virgisporangium aliadipatigenens]GIJ43532.1 hypothetical protein Val02_04180 [Virgisporangium aliadipatigenens]
MRSLSQEELDRLVRSDRNLKISLVVTLALLVALLALLIANDVPLVLGGGLGMLIGLALLIPQRRLLSDLGLSKEEAREILRRRREERSGLAALPPEARAARATRRANIYLGLGIAFIVVLVLSAGYFFGEAGKTHPEGEPLNPWFGASFFIGFAALGLGPGFLYAAAARRREAESWREM